MSRFKINIVSTLILQNIYNSITVVFVAILYL